MLSVRLPSEKALSCPIAVALRVPGTSCGHLEETSLPVQMFGRKAAGCTKPLTAESEVTANNMTAIILEKTMSCNTVSNDGKNEIA